MTTHYYYISQFIEYAESAQERGCRNCDEIDVHSSYSDAVNHLSMRVVNMFNATEFNVLALDERHVREWGLKAKDADHFIVSEERLSSLFAINEFLKAFFPSVYRVSPCYHVAIHCKELKVKSDTLLS